MLIQFRKVKAPIAIVTPLSGSEKSHKDLWLTDLNIRKDK